MVYGVLIFIGIIAYSCSTYIFGGYGFCVCTYACLFSCIFVVIHREYGIF